MTEIYVIGANCTLMYLIAKLGKDWKNTLKMNELECFNTENPDVVVVGHSTYNGAISLNMINALDCFLAGDDKQIITRRLIAK